MRWVQLVAAAAALILLRVSAGETVLVSKDPTGGELTFGEALQRPNVSKIVLVSDVDASADLLHLDGPGTACYQLTRNVTVTSQDPTDKRILDLKFMRNVVNICSTCRVAFEDMGLSNERKGNGPQIDFFVSDPWGLVVLQDVLRIRLACVGNATTGAPQTLTFPRSPLYPGTQAVSATNFTFRGTTYSNSLVAEDVSFRVERVSLEGIGWNGGYDLVVHNMVRLCETYVDSECLRHNFAEVCVAEHIDAMMGKHSALAAFLAGPDGTAVLLAVIGFLTLLFWWQLQRAAAVAPHPTWGEAVSRAEGSIPSAPGSIVGSTPHSSRGTHEEIGTTTGEASFSYAGSSRTMSDLPEFVLRSGGGFLHHNPGSWRVLHALSCSSALPCAGNARDSEGVGDSQASSAVAEGHANQLSEIHMGVLLGTGSFGKVYRGRWHDRDVAVKVIDHLDGAEAEAVGNEAKLLLSLNHGNVVKAFSFLTCVWEPEMDSPHGNSGCTLPSAVSSGSTACASRPLGSINAASSPGGLRHTSSGKGRKQRQHQQQQQLGAGSGCSSGGSHRGADSSSSSASSGGPVEIGPSPAGAALGQGRAKIGLPSQAGGVAAAAAAIAAAGAAGGGAPPSTGQPAQGSGSREHPLEGPGTYGSGYSQAGSGYSPGGLAVANQQLTSRPEGACASFPWAGAGRRSSRAIPQTAWPDSLGSLGEEGMNSGGVGGGRSMKMDRTWIVQEYCDAGTLSDVAVLLRQIAAESPQEFMRDLLVLLEGTARGLAYTHARHVVHGDLNARNVLICTSTPTASSPRECGATAKVSDFGLSRNVTTSHRTTHTYGTISHMAPERLTTGRMSAAGDVYAFGIMMWETWTGQVAFAGSHFGQVCQQVVVDDGRPPVPLEMPAAYAAIMADCWARDASARPTMDQVLQRLCELREQCEYEVGSIVEEEVSCVEDEEEEEEEGSGMEEESSQETRALHGAASCTLAGWQQQQQQPQQQQQLSRPNRHASREGTASLYVSTVATGSTVPYRLVKVQDSEGQQV